SARPGDGGERLRVTRADGGEPAAVPLDRRPLEREIDVRVSGIGLFRFMPEGVLRKFYPATSARRLIPTGRGEPLLSSARARSAPFTGAVRLPARRAPPPGYAARPGSAEHCAAPCGGSVSGPGSAPPAGDRRTRR